MAGEIDAERVRQIARLARLRLSDDEVTLFTGQLGAILEYVRQLDAVPTDGIEPLAHPFPVANVLRDDRPTPTFDTEVALRNAPQREGPLFRVPKVLDQGA